MAAGKMTSVDRMTLAQRVENELRRRILSGIYKPHTYIPSERQLTREFGVNRATVGRALQALQKAGLVVQTTGRGTRVLHPLDRLKTPVIGVFHGLSSESVGSAFRGSLTTLEGVQSALKALGHRNEVVLCRPGSLKAEWVRENFGGAIFVEQHDWEEIRKLEAAKVPVVVAKLEVDIEVSATWVDHEASTREAVAVLARLGHRRIALVARDPSYAHYGHVHRGYIAGLQEASIPFDEALVAICEKTDALSGYLATRPLLNLANPPTGIVAGRDTIAEGVCRAVKEAGLMVGHHVSVIGFDDLTWPQEEPFLTTFREPCYEMGAAAVEMLIERIVNGWRPPEKRRFDTPFILRRSAGPPLPWPESRKGTDEPSQGPPS